MALVAAGRIECSAGLAWIFGQAAVLAWEQSGREDEPYSKTMVLVARHLGRCLVRIRFSLVPAAVLVVVELAYF